MRRGIKIHMKTEKPHNTDLLKLMIALFIMSRIINFDSSGESYYNSNY